MIDFNKDVMPLKNHFYRLALRILQDHADAQDAVQETLIRLWRKINTLSSAQEAEALGTTICYNLSLDALKRAGRNHEQITPQTESDIADTAYSPIENLSRQQQHQNLHRRINNLPIKQRSVLQLRDIEGHSYKEIAATLQMTEEQVKVTLFRARQALRQSILNNKNHGL